jgi:hypothetical protein
MAQMIREVAAPPLTAAGRLPAIPRLRFVLWLAVLTAVAGVVAASSLAHSAGIQTSVYNLHRLRAEHNLWQTRNEQLKVELAKARSLTWVEHEAVSRLGMQKAAELTYLPVEAPERRAAAVEPAPPTPLH